MIELQWNPAVEAWTANLSNDVFDDLEIVVITDGETSRPTAKQREAVSLIERISQDDVATIGQLVRQFAEENWDEDELALMDEEEVEAQLEFDIHSATVSRLRETSDAYFILCGGSELDPEHGLGCVCKNGKQFAICHTDHAYANYNWDEIDELESLLSKP